MDGRRKPWFKCEKTEAAIEQPIASPVSPLYEPEKSLLTYQYFSFGISISPRILAYQPGFWHIKYVWSTFGVSVRILAYQFMFLYHLPLLTGWELQYRIQGCFHPVHVHSPVFLEQSLPFTSSTTRPVNRCLSVPSQMNPSVLSFHPCLFGPLFVHLLAMRSQTT